MCVLRNSIALGDGSQPTDAATLYRTFQQDSGGGAMTSLKARGVEG